MIRRFTISTDWAGVRRWWIVKIYPTVGQLRAAACKYDHRINPAEALGVTHHFMWIDKHQRLYFAPRGYAGIIRLTDEHLTADIVAHEITHAAIAVYRMDIDAHVRLGIELDEAEEDLAYILGDLFAAYWQRSGQAIARPPRHSLSR